ncbi:hypothetical protein I3760_04G046900, partial [Carya illinoinensis]
FIAFASGHTLPFGFNGNFDSDTIYPPVSQACTLFPEKLRRFMSYKPLPCRRCHPAAPPMYAEPYPLPTSLWTTPSNDSVVWTAYTCKNNECLVNRKHKEKGFSDCKDCFDLDGVEKTRWAASGGSYGGLDFSIDEVLATKSPGTIRIGLDIGGGVATFAVRMMARNITIVTTSMNLNGPFNNFIASRGVVPLYISISQRLPFFDNTLDIVHSMHVSSNDVAALLDVYIYRVLRPGGLFWLDHFFCVEEQFEEVYKPLIESRGYKKLKWVMGKKLDRGPEHREMYLSALLEKPLNNSW